MLFQFACALLVITCLSEQPSKECSAHLEENDGELSLVQKRGSKLKALEVKMGQDPPENSSNSTNASISTWDSAKLGNEDCKCIGVMLNGSVPVPVGNDTVMYPAEIGSRCAAWEQDRYPGCVGVDDPPDWCTQKWCYVDPCKCKLPVPPKQSTVNYKFQNKTLYWSYATCGSIDAFSEGLENACVNQLDEGSCTDLEDCAWDGKQCLGKDLVTDCNNPIMSEEKYGKSTCRCIGIAEREGYVNFTYATVGVVKYPGSVGGECQPWEILSEYPDCQNDVAPEWCEAKWCFVDPCSCTGLDNAPKLGTRGAIFQGKPVWWSYGTCGGVDIPPADVELPTFPPEYCPATTTVTTTAAPLNATNATVAANATTAAAPANATTAAAPATVASNVTTATAAPASAEAVTTAPAAAATVTGAAVVPAATTTVAAAAATGEAAAATGEAAAATGEAAVATGEAAAATAEGAATAAPAAEEAAAAATTEGAATADAPVDDAAALPVSDLGSADCECIGIDVEGTALVTFDNVTVQYPVSHGSTCKAWDQDVFPGCLVETPPDFCFSKWCYVDPCKCTLPVPPKKAVTGGRWQGKSMYWSYATCGEDDSFSASNPTACVNQPTSALCMGMEGCAWDGSQCLGRELVEDCQLADQMPEETFGTKTCRCVGWEKNGSMNIKIGDITTTYPATMGSSCSDWDNGVYADCKNETPPAWCLQKWCYVDPCDCTLPSSQPKQSSSGALYKGQPVYWSYGTCGGQDLFTQDLSALPAFPPDFCAAESDVVVTPTGETVAKKSAARVQAPAAGLFLLALALPSLS